MSDRVIIFDTTLRDGEQAPGASMTMHEKVELARLLARLGVDVIEAGFPVSSPAQFEAVSRVVEAVDGPTVCALARAHTKDVEAAAAALGSGPGRRIHTFIATSDVHLDSKFSDPRYGRSLDEKRRTILRMAVDAVRLARTFTDDVEFSAEDAGRTDAGFLCEVISAVVEAGATTINIPDTTGYCLPEEYEALFRRVRRDCAPGGAVVLSAHCHDDLGLAVANSLAAVRGGARQIECTINGIGERAGNAALEEVVMALRVRHDLFGIETEIKPAGLTALSHAVSAYSGFPVQPNKAIVGRNAFRHEAGIHQDGVLKRRDTYEIMRPEDVGQAGETIRLGRHSGRHGLFARLEKLGYAVPANEQDAVYARFVDLADQKKEIYDADLHHLMGEAAVTGGAAHYTIEQFEVYTGFSKSPEAVVCLRDRDGVEKRCDRATGDGPVDAVYRAIDHAVGTPYDLASYTIRSVTAGQDALGEVVVEIRYAGQRFTGRATSTDILKASAEAYVDAINRIELHRADELYPIGAIMDSYQQGPEAAW